MPLYTTGNVYVVSSSANQPSISIPILKRIKGVKYFSGQPSTGSTPSSAAILGNSNSSTGSQLWSDNRVGGPFFELTSIFHPNGVTVSVAPGASLWLYATVDF